MAVLSYLQGLPLAYGFALVLVAVAMTAVAMNQLRPFLIANAVLNKLQLENVDIRRGRLANGDPVYGVALVLRNRADFPIEYEMKRLITHLEGRLARKEEVGGTNSATILPSNAFNHMAGVFDRAPLPSGMLEGDVEFQAFYGRPGKRRLELSGRFKLVVATNEIGNVTEVIRYQMPA